MYEKELLQMKKIVFEIKISMVGSKSKLYITSEFVL